MNIQDIQFTDNRIIQTDQGAYTDITVDVARVLESWQLSIYSFQWMDKIGKIKKPEDLPQGEKEKRDEVEKLIKTNSVLEKPILGIGIQDNVEIGSGRAQFLTLAAMGATQIPVHIRKSHESDFKAYLAVVD